MIEVISFTGKSVGKSGSGGLFEGDIVLTDKTKKVVEGVNTFDAVASQARKWPSATVPYVFDYYFGRFFINFEFPRLRNGIDNHSSLEHAIYGTSCPLLAFLNLTTCHSNNNNNSIRI